MSPAVATELDRLRTDLADCRAKLALAVEAGRAAQERAERLEAVLREISADAERFEKWMTLGFDWLGMTAAEKQHLSDLRERARAALTADPKEGT